MQRYDEMGVYRVTCVLVKWNGCIPDDSLMVSCENTQVEVSGDKGTGVECPAAHHLHHEGSLDLKTRDNFGDAQRWPYLPPGPRLCCLCQPGRVVLTDMHKVPIRHFTAPWYPYHPHPACSCSSVDVAYSPAVLPAHATSPYPCQHHRCTQVHTTNGWPR